MKLMQKYAKSLHTISEYKPVNTLPTKAKLLLDWDIDTAQYMIGRKVDKERVLELYNAKKKAKFDEEQKVKFNKHMIEFKDLLEKIRSIYGKEICENLSDLEVI